VVMIEYAVRECYCSHNVKNSRGISKDTYLQEIILNISLKTNTNIESTSDWTVLAINKVVVSAGIKNVLLSNVHDLFCSFATKQT